MELRQLHYFVTLAEELHFGRAAARLHIVQPAVSQQLRRLEAELGVRLVDRSTRRVALTAAGQRFLPEARAVLAAAERARAAVAGPAPLRLGTSTGLGERLPRLLAELERRGRPVELVRIPGAGRLRQVATGALDAALIRGGAASARAGGLRLERVWTDALVIALPAAHPLAASSPVPLARLAALPLRLPARETNPPLADLVLDACRDAGFEPRRAPALEEQDMLAALAGGPPTWTVYYAAQAELVAAPGVAFRPPEPALSMPTFLALRPGVDDLLAACRAVA